MRKFCVPPFFFLFLFAFIIGDLINGHAPAYRLYKVLRASRLLPQARLIRQAVARSKSQTQPLETTTTTISGGVGELACLLQLPVSFCLIPKCRANMFAQRQSVSTMLSSQEDRERRQQGPVDRFPSNMIGLPHGFQAVSVSCHITLHCAVPYRWNGPGGLATYVLSDGGVYSCYPTARVALAHCSGRPVVAH